MHHCGVEVQYFGLVSSNISNQDSGVNNDNFLMMETGKDSEALDFDSEVTRLGLLNRMRVAQCYSVSYEDCGLVSVAIRQVPITSFF
jgi:hypothetical protein